MSKERPLLFQGEMVRATLDGRKTQTRRTRGLDKVNADRSSVFVRMQVLKCGNLAAIFENGNGELGSVKSPYGKAGDMLWVRETWAPATEPYEFVYRADEGQFAYRWYPSIHMPRWASRITLEVESVRVERLQDISDEDAIAEGIVLAENYRGPVAHYAALWESINGLGSWNTNPWVWVVTFKRIKP